MLIILTPPAYITYPGREVGYGDELIHQPGEISDPHGFHMACLADVTGMFVGIKWFCHFFQVRFHPVLIIEML